MSSPASTRREGARSACTSASIRASRPTPADAHARVRSLLDEGEKSIGATGPDLTHDQRQALRADFERIRRYFEQDFERNGAHGFALFASGLDNFWSPLALTEAVPDGIKVGRELYLTPLVPLVGRGEGVIVCVAGRERGQLYRLRAGRLEEIADQSAGAAAAARSGRPIAGALPAAHRPSRRGAPAQGRRRARPPRRGSSVRRRSWSSRPRRRAQSSSRCWRPTCGTP